MVAGDRLAQLEDPGRRRVPERVARTAAAAPPRPAPAPGRRCSAGRRAGCTRSPWVRWRRAAAASRSITWKGGTFGPAGHLEPVAHGSNLGRRGRGPTAGTGVRGAGPAPIDCAPAAPAAREVTPVTFDVHQLDLFLLVGSAVTLLAILAVRRLLAGRAAQPADLPADGRRARRVRVRRIELRERRARARAGLRRAGGHPGRGRSHHELARGPAVDAARALPGHGRRGRLGRRSWPSGRTTCSGCRGSSRSCSARSPPRPTRPRCSPCSAWSRCHAG